MSTDLKENDNIEGHHIIFTEKRWYESLSEYVNYLWKSKNFFITSVVSFWAFARVLIATTDNNVSLRSFALSVFVFSIAVTMYRAYLEQKEYVPEPLKSESLKTKKIFKKQQCGWNIELAKQMLEERIKESEATLNRIKKGTKFIKPKEIEYQDYIIWLKTRPEIIERLLKSTTSLCIKELPSIIAKTTSENELQNLKSEIEALEDLFESVKNSEIECHEIIPPEEFESLHEMTYGWTDPIRDGIKQLIDILNKIANIDKEKLINGTVKVPSLIIEIDEPQNIDEFCRRIEDIENKY